MYRFFDVCLGCARKILQVLQGECRCQAAWALWRLKIQGLEESRQDPPLTSINFLQQQYTFITQFSTWLLKQFCEAERRGIIISIFIKTYRGLVGFGQGLLVGEWRTWNVVFMRIAFPQACPVYQIGKNCEWRAIIKYLPLKMRHWGNRRETSKYDLKTI